MRTHFSSRLLQIVYCCWLAFETVFCYVFIVETRGRSLEETAALFDGEEAVDQIHVRACSTGDEKDVKEPIPDTRDIHLGDLARQN